MAGDVQNIPEDTTPRRRTYHRQMGRYEPVSFGTRSWWRFRDDRTESYIRQVGGDPTEMQRGLIADMVEAEWTAKKLTREVPPDEMTKERHSRLRLISDNRRALFLLRRDLRASMRHRSAEQEQAPRKASPAEHLAQRTAGRTAADILAGR
jgi:hypothetical protein